MNTSTRKAPSQVLVDGGDPQETVRVKDLVGYVDGETTNPTLISKNPEVRTLVSSGRKFSSREELDEYKKIVQAISPLVGGAGVSIGVVAVWIPRPRKCSPRDGQCFPGIPNAYIKYPCTHEGLRAAQMSVREGLRVNITLCFSQEQGGGGVCGYQRGKTPGICVSFRRSAGRRRCEWYGSVRNIKQMYEAGDGHVHVLAASIRHLTHLLGTFALRTELVTAPGKVWEEWAATSFPLPGADFIYQGNR